MYVEISERVTLKKAKNSELVRGGQLKLGSHPYTPYCRDKSKTSVNKLSYHLIFNRTNDPFS